MKESDDDLWFRAIERIAFWCMIYPLIAGLFGGALLGVWFSLDCDK